VRPEFRQRYKSLISKEFLNPPSALLWEFLVFRWSCPLGEVCPQPGHAPLVVCIPLAEFSILRRMNALEYEKIPPPDGLRWFSNPACVLAYPRYLRDARRLESAGWLRRHGLLRGLSLAGFQLLRRAGLLGWAGSYAAYERGCLLRTLGYLMDRLEPVVGDRARGYALRIIGMPVAADAVDRMEQVLDFLGYRMMHDGYFDTIEELAESADVTVGQAAVLACLNRLGPATRGQLWKGYGRFLARYGVLQPEHIGRRLQRLAKHDPPLVGYARDHGELYWSVKGDMPDVGGLPDPEPVQEEQPERDACVVYETAEQDPEPPQIPEIAHVDVRATVAAQLRQVAGSGVLHPDIAGLLRVAADMLG